MRTDKPITIDESFAHAYVAQHRALVTASGIPITIPDSISVTVSNAGDPATDSLTYPVTIADPDPEC